MDFSDSFKQSGSLCQFSPDGLYLANAAQYRVVVRELKTLQIKALFTCLDSISYLQWSCDSTLLLCAMYKRGVIQVWSIDNTDWKCKIDEGSAGLAAARFAPDGRHILSTPDFKLRITVWSLINKSVSYIKYPKHIDKGLAFTLDGKYMALAERRNCKDFVSIFACDNWEMLKHFETDTSDLADLAWSPNGRLLAVWDSVVEYKVVLYSLDGRFTSAYSAYDFALGIKSVTWSPSSQFLAIGSYDQTLRVLNNITWKTVAQHKHPSTINDANVVVYQEIQKKNVQLPWGRDPNNAEFSSSEYKIQSLPFQVPSNRPDPEKPNPKLGVGMVTFSKDSKYIATRNDNMPTVAWIWDNRKRKLVSILVQCHPIRAMVWCPCDARLAICSGSNKIYFWSPSGCSVVDVSTNSTVHVGSLLWHESGEKIVAMSKDEMCIGMISNAAL